MSTFQYFLRLFNTSVSTGRMAFLLIQICNGLRSLYVVDEPWRKSSKSLHSNRWKAVLVLSSLETCDDIFLECFIASASSGQFQTSFSRLISCQLVSFFIYPKERLVSQVRPFPFLQQCRSHIVCEYWKRSALQNRKGLADETKPTVCKHKQKQMQPSSNKHKLMVQRSLINK